MLFCWRQIIKWTGRRRRCLTTTTVSLWMMMTCPQIAKSLTTASSTNSNTNIAPLFRVVRKEPGQSRQDLPIFTTTSEGAKTLLDTSNDKDETCPASTTSVEEYPNGAFLILNVFSREECQRMMDLSEQMGYTEDAPVSLGRTIRRNENCVWMMDSHMNQVVFDRVKDYLPHSMEYKGIPLGPPIGLNQRYRFYKYNAESKDIFKAHTDGTWTWSGLDAQTGQYVDDIHHGEAISWLTFLLYLNDDFDGGSTKFFHAHQRKNDPRDSFLKQSSSNNNDDDDDDGTFHVRPRQGSVLCFYHGYHPLSQLHEGSLVTNGTKYVVRTDVMYKLPPELQQR